MDYAVSLFHFFMEKMPEQSRLSSAQKTGFVLLLVFGLLVVSLAFLQMRNTIYGPFAIKISKEGIEAQNALQFDETTRLQQIDTDQDGLNDYEELFFYETSPYIPDTDSDGIEDKDELDMGKDPLCPEGESCSSEAFDVVTTSTLDTSPLTDSVAFPDEVLTEVQKNMGLENELTSGDIDELTSNADALRQMLIMTGKISKEQLDLIDDETLLQTAKGLDTQQPDLTTQ